MSLYMKIVPALQLASTDERCSDWRATTYVPGGAISRAEARLVVIAKTQARLRTEVENLRAKIARLRAGLGR